MKQPRKINIALATVCMKTGKTYSEIAKNAGITRETMSAAVNGKIPTIATAQRLANALGVAVTDLGFFPPTSSSAPTNAENGKAVVK